MNTEQNWPCNAKNKRSLYVTSYVSKAMKPYARNLLHTHLTGKIRLEGCLSSCGWLQAAISHLHTAYVRSRFHKRLAYTHMGGTWSHVATVAEDRFTPRLPQRDIMRGPYRIWPGYRALVYSIRSLLFPRQPASLTLYAHQATNMSNHSYEISISCYVGSSHLEVLIPGE